ncbi:concanavalin A-like lectin/glucanase superfamily protein [Kineococcus xinjiangensis]|uniref:Concanavalin A-like lectin/glucanase superfamily protein n=1 Tax=Kineococcus xinjiangensis TaxID=512762 RepID=A0A2S6IDY1_9ACTN|nr:LamG domain-containing protein [Kineococcus xinjiangensis]PPK92409.1 concanavalin A-like lectin/glucanase superfamily protein [Kineococcus xinjiangensis]
MSGLARCARWVRGVLGVRSGALQWVALAALALSLPGLTGAAFTATAPTASSTLTSDTTFPTHPQAVAGGGTVGTSPHLYYRSDDGPVRAPTSTAAHHSDAARNGAYQTATDGPELWWQFDEGTGTTVADSSGSVNTGTFGATTAAPGWTSDGYAASAATFDGIDDHVTAPASIVRTDQSYSAAAWVYLDSTTVSRAVISQDGSRQSAFALQYFKDTGKWAVRLTGTDSDTATETRASSTSNAAPNTWTHLAVVRDVPNGRVRLYVNGVQEADIAWSGTWLSTQGLAVGRMKSSGVLGSFWSGRIDDVRVYSRTLSALEVVRLQTRPALQWPLAEGSGTATADVSGNGNTGTLTDGATWDAGVTQWGSAPGARAVSLDGTDDHVAGTRNAVRTDQSFTVSAWANLRSKPWYHTIVSQQGGTAADPSSASAFFLQYRWDDQRWAFTMTRTDTATPLTDRAISTTLPVEGTWYHVAGVYDDERDELRLYVNGVLEGVAPKADSTEWSATGPLQVGRARWNGGWVDHFPGLVDDVRMHRRALTAADVGALYRSPSMLWNFDEGTGSTADDSSGARNRGTLSTGMTWDAIGHQGRAVLFDGDDTVTSERAPLRTDRSFSLSTWVRLTNDTATRTVAHQAGTFSLSFTRTSNSTAVWRVEMPTSSGAAGEVLSSTVAPVKDRWTHLAVVYDDPGNLLHLYVNGVVTSTARPDTTFWNTNPLVVGRNQAGTAFWIGSIDSLATYAHPLPGSLIAALRDEGPTLGWDFEEGTGTSTADVTWNGRTGTVNGATWTTSGKPGRALTFDGVDDWVQGSTAALDTTRSFTVSVWVNPASRPARFMNVLSKHGTANSSFILEYAGGSTGGAAARWQMLLPSDDAVSPAAWGGATADSEVVAGAWTHLTGVYDAPARQVRIYVNGRLEKLGGGPSTNWNASGPVAAGAAWHSTARTNLFHGSIDTVRIVQRALDSDEVAHLHAATTPVTVPHRSTEGATAARQGALQGPTQGQTTSTAMAFDGVRGYAVGNSAAAASAAPNEFTFEAWVRTTTTQGGVVGSFVSDTTPANGGSSDRMTYVDSGGYASFYVTVSNTDHRQLRSRTRVNDGQWHHVVASMSATGTKLYVDGLLEAQGAGVASADAYSGWWRWGGARIRNRPNQPSSEYLRGTLDEVAVHSTQLSDRDVARHYWSNF